MLVSMASASLAFAISARIAVTGIANLLIAMTFVLQMVCTYMGHTGQEVCHPQNGNGFLIIAFQEVIRMESH